MSFAPGSLADLKRRAAEGDFAAQLSLARLYDGDGRSSLALQILQAAMEAGNAAAAAQLGARLIAGWSAPVDVDRGIACVFRAAELGDGEACELAAAFHADGIGCSPDWGAAMSRLVDAAERGEPRSQSLLRLFAKRVRSPGASWRDLADAFRPGDLDCAPPVEILSPSPRIVACKGLLDQSLCAWLRERARGRLSPARVYEFSTGHGREDPSRSNRVTEFGAVETDVAIAAVRRRLSAFTGQPQAHMEPLNVLHYAPGQRFVRHHDFFDPDHPLSARMIAEGGQRVCTILVYLNDDFDGAETDFPAIGLRWRGETGDAIAFDNVDPEGRPDRRTLHAGLSPTRGEKWLLTQFVRDRRTY